MSTKKTHVKSQRQLQAGEQIKRIIADVFMRGGYSMISGGYITIMEADISPDLKNCKIFVDIFGADDKKKEILKSLNQKVPTFRHELAQKFVSRVVPEILFVLDETTQAALKVDSLIDEESKKF
jgi:ribosome-binding factor A